MAATKITTRELEAHQRTAQREARTLYLWDTGIKGFGARISPTRVSWVVQKWTGGRGGKAKRIVIGHHPELELEQARKAASGVINDVHTGIDIVSKRQQVKQGQRERLQATKLADAVELYFKRKSKPSKYWAWLDILFNNHLVPELGGERAVQEFTKQELRRLVEAKEDQGKYGAARNVYAALRPFLSWCVERDIITSNPMLGLSAPRPIRARDRILTDKEIKALWSATSQQGYPFEPFYKLLLLTAQRRDEVAGMQRSEIDLAKGECIIPKERTKNGKEHLVHLSPQAVQILEFIPARYTGLLFTTTGNTSVSGFSKGKLALDALMKPRKPWRVHDLRRTAASGMAALGFQPHVVERVLNHVSGAQGGLVGVYQRHEYIPQRKQAIEAWGSHVEQLISGAHSSNVHRLPTPLACGDIGTTPRKH